MDRSEEEGSSASPVDEPVIDKKNGEEENSLESTTSTEDKEVSDSDNENADAEESSEQSLEEK